MAKLREENIELLVSSSAAAFISSAVTCATYNPLDCLRVRWQVSSSNSNRFNDIMKRYPSSNTPSLVVQFSGGRSASSFSSAVTPLSTRRNVSRVFYSNLSLQGGVLGYFSDILVHEGFYRGLYKPGLVPNVLGMAFSSSIRFGSYEVLRDDIVPRCINSFSTASYNESHQGKNKKISHVVLAASSSGAFAYVITAPFHLVKTMIQANKGRISHRSRQNTKNKPVKNFTQGIMFLLSTRGGLATLCRGSLPLAFRGALFTTGQMLGYDGTKTIAKEYGYEDAPPLHIASSITASLFASMFSAPADLLMTKYMASSGKSSLTIMEICKKTITQDGILGLWKGSNISFVRLVPVCLTYSTLYEQARFMLGIGYMS